MAKKSALVQNAQKYLQRGQIDRAIREYQRALKLDPKDLRVRHKLGELHARKGDVTEALNELGVVAAGYGQDGFFLKAVAVYKQQLKLRRDLFDVHLRLGELYHQLNLYSEAMQHYTFVADFYERNGRLAECLQVYEKIVSLDQKDLTAKLKFADLAMKLEENEQALLLLQEINLELRTSGRHQQRIPVLERMVALGPQDMALQKELAEVYIEAAELRKALGRLQICFKVDPNDPQTLDLLASVFQGLDQPGKAKAVLKELVRIFNARKEEGRRLSTLKRIARIDPQDADYLRWTTPGAVTEAPMAPKPEPVKPARRGTILYPDIAVKGRLAYLSANGEAALEESERLMLEGDLAGASRALKQAVVREDNAFRLHDRLARLLLLQEDVPGASKVILMLVKLAVGAREVQPAQRAVGMALALVPRDETVVMLASRLGVKSPETPQVPEWSDGRPYTATPQGAPAPSARPAPPRAEAPSRPLPAMDLDVDDGLVDDDDEDEGGASINVSGDYGGELTSIHLDPSEESNTSVGMPAYVPPAAPAPAAADEFYLSMDLVEDELVDDLEEEGDAFDLAQELVDEEAFGASASQEVTGDDAPQLRAHVEMAKAYLEMGLHDEAIQELTGLPLDGEAAYLLGRAQRESGDLPASRDTLEQALETESLSLERRRDALFELAQVLEALGDDYRALEFYRALFSESRTYRSREVRSRIAQVTGRLGTA